MAPTDAPFPPSILAARRRMDIGLALMASGDAAAARDCFQAAAEADPNWAEAWFALAEAGEALGDREAAVAGYAAYLARRPDDAMGALARLALLGAAVMPDCLPAAYVRRLFDDYAPRFDAALGALEYRGPQMLRGLWDRLDRPTDGPLAILDLGCGTGLSGAAFADLPGTIDGVDLAPAMAARARRRGCYRRVAVGDLVAALESEPAGGRTLLIAADVLNYVGALAPVFAAAARVLAPAGVFLIALEAGEGAGLTLGPGQRFRHAPDYVADAAGRAGLRPAALEHAPLRRERGRPVDGLLVALVPEAAAAAGDKARRGPETPPRRPDA